MPLLFGLQADDGGDITAQRTAWVPPDFDLAPVQGQGIIRQQTISEELALTTEVLYRFGGLNYTEAAGQAPHDPSFLTGRNIIRSGRHRKQTAQTARLPRHHSQRLSLELHDPSVGERLSHE